MTTATRARRRPPKVDPKDTQPTIDPRIRARRVAVKRSAGRRRLRWVGIALAPLGLVALGGALALTPLLDVDRSVVSGQFRTAPDDIVATGGIARGSPLVSVDLAAAEERVEAMAWITDATVTREWPGTIRYRVVEREPVGAVEVADGRWVAVGAEGRVLIELDGDPGDLPHIEGVVTGSQAGDDTPETDRGPFRVAEAIPVAARPMVEAVVLGTDGAVTVRLVAGGTVVVGPLEDLSAKGIALASVLTAVDPCVATLDLSIADAPVLTRVPGCG